MIIVMSRVLFIACAFFMGISVGAQTRYERPPEVLAQLVDAPRTPAVMLSSTRRVMLLLHRSSVPGIAKIAEPELRLAGLRINPRNTGPSRYSGYERLSLKTLDGSAARPVTGVPEDAAIGNVSFSPDGQHVAFTVMLPERIEAYVASVADGQARRLTTRHVNDASPGAPLRWVSDSQSLLVKMVPLDRGEPPVAPLAPAGPVIQENAGQEAPARTYQDMLQNSFDEALFSYYLNTEVVRVTLGGDSVPIGEAGLIMDVDPSPDGRFVLLERLERPFSYLVPYSRFPHVLEVYDASGELVRTVAQLPLAETVPTRPGSVRTGPRSMGWRADAGATLYWAEAIDGGDARVEAEHRDQLYTLAAPFEGAPELFLTLQLRYSGILWGNDTRALVRESWYMDRKARWYVMDPSQPDGPLTLLFDLQMEDRYNNPGSPLMKRSSYGTAVLMMQDDALFMVGTGASPEGNRPFLRKFDLATQQTQELFRSQAPYYERPLALLDDALEKMLTLRESVTEPPNYFVRDLSDGSLVSVTAFAHPYPELTAIQKEVIQYTREDSIPLSATLYLPPGYEPERDGPLPGLVWAYPNEFKSADAAGQRRDSPYQFMTVSYSGFVPYVTRGYAVINNASMPVIGEGDEEPNDTFREQLVSNAQSAIDEGVRRGVLDPERVAIGGHSYGAFMTANLLAHSDLFRAGVARSGAYNRTLTPFGFQNEQRLFWESPETYYYMSPFMHADKIDEPILLIHGEADNNSGTFPVQSRRLYGALKGLGKTARLVMLPHESHGYRSRESILHVLWETDRWLEQYVKKASPRVVDIADPSGD